MYTRPIFDIHNQTSELNAANYGRHNKVFSASNDHENCVKIVPIHLEIGCVPQEW